MADNLEELYGDYAADVDPIYAKTPLEGLKSMAAITNYAAGCADNSCHNYSAGDIKKAVTGSQLVIICVGTGMDVLCCIDAGMQIAHNFGGGQIMG